jgi:myo-inositol-1(or 4)-monophosphatase
VSRNESRWGDIPPLPQGANPVGVGSVAYRLAMLAKGRAHAGVTAYGRSEWDVAAGVALCMAAGLRTTDVLGEEIPFNQEEPYVRGLLVGQPAVHQAISEHFRRVGAVR